MFPLFGWYPEFARNHTPRYPVELPEPKPHRTRPTHERGGALESRRPGPLRPVDDPAQPNAERRDEGDDADMSEYQEFTGKSVEEAIKGACDAFGVGLGDLDFEILTPGSRGVLGMGAEPARIVAAPRSALGGAAPKREAAEATPLPAAAAPRGPARTTATAPTGDRDRDRPPATARPRRDRADRGPSDRGGYDRGPRRDDRPSGGRGGSDRGGYRGGPDRGPRRDDRPRTDAPGPRRLRAVGRRGRRRWRPPAARSRWSAPSSRPPRRRPRRSPPARRSSRR